MCVGKNPLVITYMVNKTGVFNKLVIQRPSIGFLLMINRLVKNIYINDIAQSNCNVKVISQREYFKDI